MAIKLLPLTISKRIHIWVISTSYISSTSCATSLETVTETNFERKIEFLRNKLVPNNLIRVLDDTEDLSSALKIFKWASLQTRFRHTPETYARIILKLGFAGSVEEMEGFCRNMVRDKIPGTKEALLALIDAFVKHCRLSEALLVLVTMNSGGYIPSIETVNALMCALVREKREFLDVLLVYKEMVKAGISPSVETLNCLLEALLDSDRVEAALDQFKRMGKKGCSPNSRSFEILIKGLVAKDRVDEAVGVLLEIFECGCKPDLSFFTGVIPLLCRENKPNEGMRLFRMMKDCDFELDCLTCTALMECFCENLWRDEAVALFEEMIKVGLSPPVSVVVDVVNMFCELGTVDEAAKFLEVKYVNETSPYNALLEGCYRAGKFSMAMDMLVKMSERNVDDCDSWNILLRWVCEQQGIKKASELLGKMVVSSFIPDCGTYSALVVGNCKSRKYEKALEMFHRIRANRWVLDSVSYSKLVEGLCSVGLIPEAAELFCYMSRYGCSLWSLSFDMLINGVCDAGKLGEAIKLCQLAYCSDTHCTSSTYTTIMRALLKENRSKDVPVVFSQMLVSSYNHLAAEAYCVLIEGMSLLNRVKDCVLLFNKMVDEGLVPDSKRLFDTLSRLANHRQLFAISRSIDRLIPGEVMNTSIYNVLVRGLWKEGKENEARWLLDLMLEKGWVPDAKTHGLLTGSITREDIDFEGLVYYANSSAQDTVSDILVEGLDNPGGFTCDER